MREVWKDIKNYEGLYQVSDLGNVRSLDHYASNGKKNILYLGKNLKGTLDGKKQYLQVTLSKNDINKKALIHRLVAEAFIPNEDNKREVNHINGIKTDNRLNNLEWVTSKENKRHAINLGLYNKIYGAKKGSPKIFINGLSISEIAKRENISYQKAYNKYVRYRNG